MKILVRITEDVSDEQRKQIAEVLDLPKDKRTSGMAKAEACKSFLWAMGESWATSLGRLHAEKHGLPETPDDAAGDELDALLGAADAEDAAETQQVADLADLL